MTAPTSRPCSPSRARSTSRASAPDELGAALERLLATGAVPDAYDGSRPSLAALKDMTSRLIGRFVVAVEQRHPGRARPRRR